MKDIVSVMTDFNNYLRGNKIEGSLSYMGETSHFVRAANSAISLNTTSETSLFTLTIHKGKKKISRSLTHTSESLQNLKKETRQMLEDIECLPDTKFFPLRGLPIGGDPLEETSFTSPHFDEDLKSLDKKKVVDIFSSIVEELGKYSEKNHAKRILVSGAFSAGEYAYANINTQTLIPLLQKGTDFDIEVVLQLPDDHNKELRAAQAGEDFSSFNLQGLLNDLIEGLKIKSETKRQDLVPGKYDLVLTASALAELLDSMFLLSFYGEFFEYGLGMFGDKKDSLGKRFFSPKITLVDLAEDSLLKRSLGMNGVLRKEKTILKEGVLNYRYYSNPDECDFFDKAINDDISVSSITMQAGDGPKTLSSLIQEISKKTLVMNFVHYINFTNQNKGEFTGTSRFGTWCVEGGKIESHLFNLRINDNFFNLFSHIDWLSSDLVNVSRSDTYSRRCPKIYRLPRFIKISNVNISASSGSSAT